MYITDQPISIVFDVLQIESEAVFNGDRPYIAVIPIYTVVRTTVLCDTD